MNSSYPKQYELWLADLEPSLGSEPGKIRPVLVIQSELFNKAGHSSIVVCPISSQHKEGVTFIRIAIGPSVSNGLSKKSYILSDQVRAIDLKRLKRKIGVSDAETVMRLNEALRVILAL